MDTISTYKSRIDGLMNILFGAGVSNPQTIIEQLNYLLFLRALSVKDDEAELLGIADESGKIFTGNLSKYKWSNLLALNAEDLFKTLEEAFDAIQKKSENATVKLLFRNAHVKIFDKPTLRRVLHEIEEFAKELDTIAHEGNKDVFGDMYEYLLSKLASAGTNGQFRTPRHIIDFMVRVLDPKKSETILDPACGTAGFLVATYRYIAGEYTSDKLKKAGSPRAMDKLSSEEKNFLYNHMFTGFDSDEDMIKFGMMNLHLHGLTKSRLVRQNTLVDTTGFKDKFDVILANPPFSGKIDEESVSEDIRMGTKATELLFLRFMMDHMSSKGKMAVIVPEGVIFNASRANSKIREMLLDNGLWAVVSLPAGVFNPYAGVKTSILLLDRAISSKMSELLFIKVSHDGYDLGAQRHAHSHNDLPLALEILNEWKRGKKSENGIALYVEKAKIGGAGDHSLSGDRYRVSEVGSRVNVPFVELRDVVEINQKSATPEELFGNNKFCYIDISCVENGTGKITFNELMETKDAPSRARRIIQSDDVLLSTVRPNLKAFAHISSLPERVLASTGFAVLTPKEGILGKYLHSILFSDHVQSQMESKMGRGAYPSLNQDDVASLKIPLPPLEIQQQIVTELDGYSAIITGAKQVTESWKPAIDIDPEWTKVKLGDEDVIQIVDGDRGSNYPSKGEFASTGYCLFLNTSNVRKGVFDFTKCDFITKEKDGVLRKGKLIREDVVLTTRGTLGNTAYYSASIPYENVRINSGMVILRSKSDIISPEFLLLFLNSLGFDAQVTSFMSGSAQPQLPIRALSEVELSLPPLEIQRQIVEKIEAERTLVESAKKLIAIYEQKTKETIAKLWSE